MNSERGKELSPFTLVMSLLALLIVGGVNTVIREELGRRAARERSGRFFVHSIGKLQILHHQKFGRFEKDLDKLEGTLYPERGGATVAPEELDDYYFRSVIQNGKVVSLGQTKRTMLRSYRQTIWFDKETQEPVSLFCVTKEPGMPADSADRDAHDPNRACVKKPWSKYY